MEIPRTRQYAQITSLTRHQEQLSKKLAQTFSLYEVHAPRSNQIVGGKQVIGDTVEPEGVITLYRPQVKQTMGNGENLEGVVSTHYDINAERSDNVAVKTMRIEKDGTPLKMLSGLNQTGFINLTGLFFTGIADQKYIFGAEDFNGNIKKIPVTLHIKIPEIWIDHIENDSGSSTAQIIAQIKPDVDEGNVVFQRARNGTWKEVTGNNMYSNSS